MNHEGRMSCSYGWQQIHDLAQDYEELEGMLRSSRRPCVQHFLAQRCQELHTQVQEVPRPASSCHALKCFAAAPYCRGLWAVSCEAC